MKKRIPEPPTPDEGDVDARMFELVVQMFRDPADAPTQRELQAEYDELYAIKRAQP